MSDATAQSNASSIRERGVKRAGIMAIVVGVACTGACGVLVALGHNDLAGTRVLGLVGMGGGIVSAGCAVVVRATGKKALFATAGVLLLIAASSIYGISWT